MSYMSELDIERQNKIKDNIRELKRNAVIGSLLVLFVASVTVWCLACTDRMCCWIHLILLGITLICLSITLDALKKVKDL